MGCMPIFLKSSWRLPESKLERPVGNKTVLQPGTLLFSTTRFFKFLTSEQRLAFLGVLSETAHELDWPKTPALC
jgi:hypothetical protein